MRTSKHTALKQRLRRGDPMDFSALLQGVSTLDDAAEGAPAGPPVEPEEDASAHEGAGEVAAAQQDAPPTVPATLAAPEAPPSASTALDPAAPPHAASAPPPAAQAPAPPVAGQPATLYSEPVVTAVPPARPAAVPRQDDRLRTALDSLGCQLTLEVGRMAAALRTLDADEAGFRLSHVNQILDLLRSIDASGDVSRQLGLPCAPPADRAWPTAAWTVVEFAESPFSGLLPAEADEPFVRELLYSAWGVGFDA